MAGWCSNWAWQAELVPLNVLLTRRIRRDCAVGLVELSVAQVPHIAFNVSLQRAELDVLQAYRQVEIYFLKVTVNLLSTLCLAIS